MGFASVKKAIVEELEDVRDGIRETRCTPGFLFALFCVALVIVGNVILLISINFWLVQFPADNLEHTSGQVALQVSATAFMVFFFTISTIIFVGIYGIKPLIRVLMSTDRVAPPTHRALLLIASGATNAACSVSGVYAMAHTPEFIQAVLLCCIPFSAQAWTVVFIPVERERDYLSLFFIASFVLFVGGVLLSSLSAFLHNDGAEGAASVPWALIYLISSIMFGLWCVIQRLYLDAVVREERQASKRGDAEDEEHRQTHEIVGDVVSGPSVKVPVSTPNPDEVATAPAEEIQDEERELLLAEHHEWNRQDVDSNSAKLVLLEVGIIVQLIVTFVLFPVDAIPWFGTSSNIGEAWEGFQNAMQFIFSSWMHVRYGLMYSMGFIMSFVGCTYLNEHSPTLASVVLQLAGPVTSLTIIIVPAWDVYKANLSTGQQVGGVILLLVAALLYHVWEQRSMRRLVQRAAEQHRRDDPALTPLAKLLMNVVFCLTTFSRVLIHVLPRMTRRPVCQQRLHHHHHVVMNDPPRCIVVDWSRQIFRFDHFLLTPLGSWAAASSNTHCVHAPSSY